MKIPLFLQHKKINEGKGKVLFRKTNAREESVDIFTIPTSPILKHGDLKSSRHISSPSAELDALLSVGSHQSVCVFLAVFIQQLRVHVCGCMYSLCSRVRYISVRLTHAVYSVNMLVQCVLTHITIFSHALCGQFARFLVCVRKEHLCVSLCVCVLSSRAALTELSEGWQAADLQRIRLIILSPVTASEKLEEPSPPCHTGTHVCAQTHTRHFFFLLAFFSCSLAQSCFLSILGNHLSLPRSKWC